MISLEKWEISTPLQKMPKNVGDLGKLIVAKDFEKLPKVQKIAQPGHYNGGCPLGRTTQRWRKVSYVERKIVKGLLRPYGLWSVIELFS